VRESAVRKIEFFELEAQILRAASETFQSPRAVLAVT
jgi:hypothetical protein